MASAVLNREKAEPAEESETVTAVRAMTVAPAARRPLLFLLGETEARDHASITAPLSAEVLTVAVQEGDYFPKGKRLLRFDLRELNLTRRQQEAENEEINLRLSALQRDRRADAQRLQDASRLLQLAEKNYERNKKLLQGGAVTEAQAEASEQAFRQRRQEFTAMRNQLADYETREKTAQTQLARGKSRLEQTAILIERAQIRAPFAGRVVRVHAAAGQRPAAGGVLLDIFNPKRMRLRVALPQRYAFAADESLQAVINQNDADITLSFDGIEPRVDSGEGSIDVFFALPGDDWVLGATHEARVELPPRENLVAVPVDAIYNDDRIYRIGEDGRAHAEFCGRAGLGMDGGTTAALLSCPTLKGETKIVANQLPQLVDSAKVEVLE